nr:IS3 family transposase [Gluconacetobacter asukensis]
MRPARKRELVDKLQGEWKISTRRACAVLQIDRSLYVYKSKRGTQAELTQRIREICETRVRYGYRRVPYPVAAGWLGRKPEADLSVFTRSWACNCATRCPGAGSRRKCARTVVRRRTTRDTWAMDFVHDQLATGRKIRILTVIDTFSRFSPATDPRFSYRGEDVVQTLERICGQIGYPRNIRLDQGSEFVSRDLDLWAYQKGGVLDFSRPGKPTDNSFIESFNGKFRAECLNTHWFMSLDDARAKMEAWRQDYNEVRPHSAIGNKPPISLLNGSAADLPVEP